MHQHGLPSPSPRRRFSEGRGVAELVFDPVVLGLNLGRLEEAQGGPLISGLRCCVSAQWMPGNESGKARSHQGPRGRHHTINRALW